MRKIERIWECLFVLSLIVGCSLFLTGCPAKQELTRDLEERELSARELEVEQPREPKNTLVKERLPIFMNLPMKGVLEKFGEPDETEVGSSIGDTLWTYTRRQTSNQVESLKVWFSSRKLVYKVEWYAGVPVPIQDTLSERFLNLEPRRIIANKNSADSLVWLFDKTYPESFWGKGVTVYIGTQATQPDWLAKTFNSEEGVYEWSVKEWRSANIRAYGESSGGTNSLGLVNFCMEFLGPDNVSIGAPY